MVRIRFFLVALFILTAVLPAGAQRTAKGERFLRASYDYVPANGYGADMAFGLYSMDGFLDFSVEASLYDYSIVSDETFLDEPASSVSGTARAGYMYRLLSNRSRRLNFYAGGGVMLGVGTFSTSDDGWGQVNKSNVSSGQAEWSGTVMFFRYGIYPKAEVEAFFIDNLAVDVAVKCPVTFTDASYSVLQKICRPFHCELSAGIKYNF